MISEYPLQFSPKLWQENSCLSSVKGVNFLKCILKNIYISSCFWFISVQLLSRVSLCDPMGCSMPGFPVHHQFPELAQTDIYQLDDAIQPSHPLSSPSPPAFNLSQHQGLFQRTSSSCQVARVLELQLLHQAFQWIFRIMFFRVAIYYYVYLSKLEKIKIW